jgi:uncharacterized protein (TIGR03435 family)
MRSLLFLTALAAFGQEFEVASIKPAPPIESQVSSGKMNIGMHVDGARVDIGSMTLADLIPIAYRVKRYQVSGPSWMTAQRFNIQATIPEGTSKDKVPEMLQALLADRFKLAVHRESKEHGVYALVVAKGGHKLKDAPPAAEPSPDAAGGRGFRINPDGKGAVVSGGRGGLTKVAMGQNGAMHFEVERMDMAGFADFLSRFVERPVVDMTELKGEFQIAVDLSMEELRMVSRAAGITIPGGPAAAEPG